MTESDSDAAVAPAVNPTVAELPPPETGQGNPIWKNPLALVGLWLVAGMQLFGLATIIRARENRWDFSHYYASAFALRLNLDPYRSDLSALGNSLGLQLEQINRATYPPSFLVCFEPLTFFSPSAAYWIWTALNLLLLIVALGLLLGGLGLDSRTNLVLVALVILYPPVADHVYYSQCQILILVLLIVMMRLMRRGNEKAAGMVLAAASLLRGYPVILAGYLLVRRKWRMLAWMITTFTAGLLVTFYAVGVERSLGFVSNMRLVTSPMWLGSRANIAFQSFIGRLIGYIFGMHTSPLIDMLSRATSIVARLILLGLTIRATASKPSGDDPQWRALSLWIVTMIMVAPTAWLHYMVLLFVPFAEMISAASREAVASRALRMAAASYVILFVSRTLLGLFGTNIPFATLAILAEGGFVSLLVAYVATYWFSTDDEPFAGRDTPTAPA